jgi:hypothetical protein
MCHYGILLNELRITQLTHHQAIQLDGKGEQKLQLLLAL